MAASPDRLIQIRDLVNQWEMLVGHTITIPDWAINEMASNLGISNLFGVGQYMADHQRTGAGESRPGGVGAYFIPEWYAGMPWARYGMSATEYDTKLEGFDNAFRVLTGQNASQDLIDRALHDHEGAMTGGQFETWLLAQDSIKNTYGWLKYGLDFQQFQTQKLQMRQQFGRELTDAEGVEQLRYLHQAQGPNLGAAAQQTFGQLEKKQAQTGLSGSVVR